jgi:hypothetical protein
MNPESFGVDWGHKARDTRHVRMEIVWKGFMSGRINPLHLLETEEVTIPGHQSS